MDKETYAKYKNHWVTSDIHFNHESIRKYCPESRGHLQSSTEMNEEIIRNWNATVDPADHTFIIGDVAMGLIEKAPALIQRLNGAKTLIRGNHDRSLMKNPANMALFLSTHDYLCFSVKKVGVVMCHFPIAHWDSEGRGSVMLHGHLHSPKSKVHIFPERRIIDVGLDGNDLRPRHLETTIEMLTQIPLPSTDHHGDPVDSKSQ
jgi:calcineurin-like phosphoesterase family protein